MKQQTLAMASGFERYGKKTRRTLFLEEMEQVVPWSELCRLIEPVYAKAGNGRPPVGAERMLADLFDFTHQRYRYKHYIDEVEREKNRTKSSVRSKVEHVFAVMKLKFGFVKVRYRGLDKNANRLFVTCALVNLFLVRKRLLTTTLRSGSNRSCLAQFGTSEALFSRGETNHGPLRLFTLSWHERGACSEVPKSKHPVFNRRELRLLGIAHLFGRTILLSRDVDCHRMIKRLLGRVAAAGLLSPPRGREHIAETLWRGGLGTC